MILLDVSFGIFAFMPQGWIFMAFVILCECVIVSKLLAHQWKNKKIYWAVALTNVISGAAGIITTLWLNGGWYLVVWFPWVSSHEIDFHRKNALQFLAVFYILSFIGSLIIESITNILFLQKIYLKKDIIKATVIANVVTYVVGSIILYSYSFGLI